VLLEERAGLALTLPVGLTLLDWREAGEAQLLIATRS
jgi:hypothetical protein